MIYRHGDVPNREISNQEQCRVATARIGGGAVGSGGNFADTLTVADGKVIPRGGLALGPGEQIIRLEVWMTQQTGADAGAALTCTLDLTALRGSTTEWDASGSNIDFEGDFVEGVATGTALAVIKVGNLVKTRSWNEMVVLEP